MGGCVNRLFCFVKKLSTENLVRKKMMKKKIHIFLSLCFLRKGDDVRGRGRGGERKMILDNVWRKAKKLTFQNDVISGQPLMGLIEPGWKGLTRKIVPIGRGVCMRLLRIVINYWSFYHKI